MRQLLNNDVLHILRVLFEEREVDVYDLHASTKIPPSTLFSTLEHERSLGRVVRENLCYRLTPEGESFLASELGMALLNPDSSFRDVPEKYSGLKVSMDDVSVINDI